LIKYTFKKDNKLNQFEEQYPITVQKKSKVIGKFSSVQLEELLNNSTKNVAQEVVNCLIPNKDKGVLINLEQLVNNKQSVRPQSSKPSHPPSNNTA